MHHWIKTAVILSIFTSAIECLAQDAKSIVANAMERWRGTSSIGEMKMTIHRPDWQRSIRLKNWTSGLDQSLILVTAPAKDKGNATLLIDQQLWSYSPKINRVIKIPSSMMSQSWLGSDFSNRDITKSTEILDQYDFNLVSTETSEEHNIYTIEAIPHNDAPVVWGKELLTIRDDYVMLKQAYYDQDMLLVKELNTLAIDTFNNRTIASHMRIHEVDTPEQWTDMEIISNEFDVSLPANTFTLSHLRSIAR